MTLLTTWADSDSRTVLLRTTEPAEISAALSPIGVRFEQWPVHDGLPSSADSATILAAYRAEVDKLVTEENFSTVDVASLHPSEAPDWPETAKAARERFLREHTHDDDDEVRFFIAGAGIFYLHVQGKVHAVYCEKGDLLGVPRGTTHWFDMGAIPSFTAIRFFHEEDGWIGNFTGSDIASRFPDFDEIRAGYKGEVS
ncbi:1,2-dihydroxy-3-keto-5-methylthiopentene dioxygenase [Streptomyces bauhiniae]